MPLFKLSRESLPSSHVKRMNARWKVICITGIILLVMGSAVGADEYPELNLRYTNFLPEKASHSQVDIWVANEISRRTNGRVQIQLFHNQTLGKSTEIIDLVGGGAVDIGTITFAYNFSRMPMLTFFNTPKIYKDHVIAAKLSKLGYQTQKTVREDMARNELHPLFFRALNEFRLISKNPIRTLADFRDLRVRTFGAVHPKMFEKLGAVPVTMEWTDAYEALMRGSVDAVYLSWTAFYTLKLFEAAPYISDVNFGAIVGYLTFVNLDLWNSWPKELKNLFHDIGIEAEHLSNRMVGESDQKSLELMIAAGAELVHFQDRTNLKPYCRIPSTLLRSGWHRSANTTKRQPADMQNF